MSSHEIASQLENILSTGDNENFIYDFLLAYGISKSIISRLKKGDQNRSKRDNEVLYAKKILFRVENGDNLLNAIDSVSSDSIVAKHIPRFALMTDYEHLVAKDLKLGKTLDIAFNELPKHYDFFLPLAGSEVYHSANDNEADRNAAYKMVTLYDHLISETPDIYQSKEQIHSLNVFLSRLLFCFFAEDTGIFAQDSIFTNTLVQHTAKDGSDTHLFLDKLFARLDSQDTKDLPQFLADFPYVNGGLFRDKISSPIFSAKARKILVELGELQWKNINPDIFGSMIQAVTNKVDRSNLGQHYTSVPNIKKLIKPLFLDEFYEELEKATTVNQLYKLQNRIAKAKFFDPACGSGNFLIITYKELRVLEIELIKQVIELSENVVMTFGSQIKISQFYGIEFNDFAHEIAILSLWLAEHQMNIIFEEQLSDYAVVSSILPLKTMGNIKQGNAIRENWEKVCPISDSDEVYIIGNPPYCGSARMDLDKKADLALITTNSGKLDYVAGWFILAEKYIKNRNAKCALVATNSICQGEQVDLLWNKILSSQIEIDFAYTSFSWENNAKSNAVVAVVIVAIRNTSNQSKYIFSNNFKNEAKNINAYLRDERDIIISPLSNSNKILGYESPNRVNYISKSDALFFDEQEKDKNINEFNKKFIRQLIGAAELISGTKKYCLYINESEYSQALKDNFIRERVNLCKVERENDILPYRFCKKHIAEDKDYLVIPRVSSEKRAYLPIELFRGKYAYTDSVQIIENPTPIISAILLSKMHMVWINAIGGKLETRYRYSSRLCYNTFPFPQIDKKQQENLRQYVLDIIEARANHIGKTLAWMYNPDTMPNDLKQAHQALDEAIEQCYRLKPFDSDSERLEYLFKLYEKMISEEKTTKSTPKAKSQ
ncbi:class I SAM-dependent DNA methyltransferase [Acinetobacter sp. c1-l78]|uniref:class I SAM-dependent DNA methyltransferase n=1 Tax=Acinetobacter sp. c1-l78 TaxID=3342803 RepID=UPI0035B98150